MGSQKKNRKIPVNKKPVRKNKSQKWQEAQKAFSEQEPEEKNQPALFIEEKQAKPDIILVGKSNKFKKCHASKLASFNLL